MLVCWVCWRVGVCVCVFCCVLGVVVVDWGSRLGGFMLFVGVVVWNMACA